MTAKSSIRRTRKGLLLALLAPGAAAAWLAWGNRAASGVAAPAAPAVAKARVAAAIRRDLPIHLYALGTVEASQTVIIRPRVDGIVLRVLFHEGERVPAQAPLFEIDPTLYRTQTDQADATLARDQATLLRARGDLQRLDELASRQLVPRQSLDQQRSTVAELEATLQFDRATLAAARAQLGWTTVRSPIAGRVGRRLVDVGNLVHATSDTALVDVVQTDPVNLVFSVPQEKLTQIQERLAAGALPIAIRSGDGWTPVGQNPSVLIYNTVDRATGSIMLRAVVANPNALLWPGQAVDVRITPDIRNASLCIPEQAIFEANTGPAVYVVDDTHHVHLRQVTPLSTSDGWTGVAGGVRENEQVIIADQERFAPDTEVEPEVAQP